MIRIKNEGDRARVRGVTPETVLAINIAYSVFRDMFTSDMTITSVGEIGYYRKKGSKHMSGNAFDIRTYGLAVKEQENLVYELGNALGDDYDVVLESNHIHVEYDSEP